MRTCHLLDVKKVDHRVKNQRKAKRDNVFRPCQRTKKAVEYEGDSDTMCSWCAWKRPQRLGKGDWKN